MMRILPQVFNSPAFVKPDRFQVVLERDIFFPGEVVKGNLILNCSTPINCRGVRVHLQGKGSCHFVTGSGDDREEHDHTQYYSNCKRTVFGTVHKTAIIRNAGANAIFGPPWSPDEGDILIGVHPSTEHLIFRVMDVSATLFRCRKDDLLGECLVEIKQFLNSPTVVLPLFRKGKQDKSTIEFSIKYDDNYSQLDVNGQPLRGIYIRLFKAINLRSGDWFGKNDVYVQVYGVTPGTHPNQTSALPEPQVDMILPVGHFTIPFSFQLPQNLPSSMVSLSGDDYISYSVYAYIDIAWRSDPSTRHFFTVMQHQNPSLYITPAEKLDESFHIAAQGVIPPFCCFSVPMTCCGDYGSLSCKMSIPRSSYAPGETINVHVEFHSNWPEFSSNWKSLTINLNQVVTCWAEGCTYTYERSLTMPCIHYNTGGPAGAGITQDFPFHVPIAPPTYTGGFWAMRSSDPIIWHYSILLELRVSLPGFTCGDSKVYYRLPVVITTVNQSTYDAIQGGLKIFDVVKRPANRSMPTANRGVVMGGNNNMYMQPAQMQNMQFNQPMQMQSNMGMMQQPNMMMQPMQQQPMMGMGMNQYGGHANAFPQTPQSQFQYLPMAQTIPQALPYNSPMAQGVVLNVAPLAFNAYPTTPERSLGPVFNNGYETPIIASHLPEPQTPPKNPQQSSVNYGNNNNYNTSQNNYQQNAPVDHTNQSSGPYFGGNAANVGNSAANASNNAGQFQSSHHPQNNGHIPTVPNPTTHVLDQAPSQGYREGDYSHAPELYPNFSGNIELVESATRRIIRDPEEDFTVQDEIQLMYCPLYFKCS